MGLTKSLKDSVTLALNLLICLTVFVGPVGFAADEIPVIPNKMLIRTIPLEVSAYPEAANISEQATSAQKTIAGLTESPNLLVHMELLREAYGIYGDNSTEKPKLIKALKDRYWADQENPEKFFDYGYSQLVFDANKNGLFFLRKANDKIASPFTNLAYGLAQIDADIYFEKAAINELTTRKMDAVYKLKDALTLNRDAKKSGVWASYVAIVQALKAYPAYESIVTEDVSTIYVPYSFQTTASTAGINFLAVSPNTPSAAPQNTLSTLPKEKTLCHFDTQSLDWKQLADLKAIDLDNDGHNEGVAFLKTTETGPYQVVVYNEDRRPLAMFSSNKTGYLAEDLNGDGIKELVVRQYDSDPMHPVSVYRWNGQCFNEDKDIKAYFQ